MYFTFPEKWICCPTRYTALHDLKSNDTNKACGREASHTKLLRFYSNHFTSALGNIMPPFSVKLSTLLPYPNFLLYPPETAWSRASPRTGLIRLGFPHSRVDFYCLHSFSHVDSWPHIVLVLPGWKKEDCNCSNSTGSLDSQTIQQACV